MFILYLQYNCQHVFLSVSALSCSVAKTGILKSEIDHCHILCCTLHDDIKF